jgi:uracil-DNA glycosylase
MAGIDKDEHLILSSVHPSPLSASRGFFGNQHFKKANDWLKEKYGEEGVVDWTKLEPEKAVKEPLKALDVIDDAVW